jgi:hypothetical protein
VKLFVTMILLLLLGACCFAQSAAADGSGLVLVKKKWHRELRNPVLDHDPNDETADRSAEDIRRRPIEQTNDSLRQRSLSASDEPEIRAVDKKPGTSADYVYEITVRNDTGKDVASVTWEYVFFAPDANQEVGRRHFTSRETIEHGKTRTLTIHSAIPPTGTIDVSKAGAKSRESYTEKIVIISIEYTNGSK